jgi:hypothetical protein
VLAPPELDPEAPPLVLPVRVPLDEPVFPEDDPLVLPAPLAPPSPVSDPAAQQTSAHAVRNETMTQRVFDMYGTGQKIPCLDTDDKPTAPVCRLFCDSMPSAERLKQTPKFPSVALVRARDSIVK